MLTPPRLPFALLVSGAFGAFGAFGAAACGDDVQSEESGLRNGDLCALSGDCIQGSVCWTGQCVTAGDLRMSLVWEVDTDIDLHVRTPSGAEVHWDNPRADGGHLDLDDCEANVNVEKLRCRHPGSTHVENIYFSAPSSGTYTIVIKNFSDAVSVPFELEVATPSASLLTESGTVGTGSAAEVTFTHEF